ncbi:MAG: hypothetical protein KC635_05530, partial [Myxococcales bacterium]|nr:hypothetical protein [Myxococcales bacterium]
MKPLALLARILLLGAALLAACGDDAATNTDTSPDAAADTLSPVDTADDTGADDVGDTDTDTDTAD